jgi:hypothetical protein
MATKNDEIKVSTEKRTEMFSEKDYLVKLVMASLKKAKPKEAADILEAEAIGLLNHYAKLESEIYFVERFNEMLESVLASSLEKNKVITKC